MVLRRPSIAAVTKEGGRAFPERTIGERTILGVSGTMAGFSYYGCGEFTRRSIFYYGRVLWVLDKDEAILWGAFCRQHLKWVGINWVVPFFPFVFCIILGELLS